MIVPYLSICIPTYNRLDIMENTLSSIYANIEGIEINDFEVVISDNSPDHSTEYLIEKFHYPNIKYIVTTCEGFLNSFHVLENGKGMYLKLHNNYTMFCPGTLFKMIKEIKENVKEKPVIFHTNGMKQKGKIFEYKSFDNFMYNLSYFSSWSTGFGIWRDDFEKIKKIQIDIMFPQTSLLLEQYNKSSYILNDNLLFKNQNVPKKGGYNIFKVFSVDYISLIEQSFLKKRISNNTFNRIKNDLLFNYLSVRFFKTIIAKLDNFDTDNIKQNIKIYYSSFSYYKMVALSLFSPFRFLIRKMSILHIKSTHNEITHFGQL